MWVLFRVPTPTPAGETAEAELGEEAIVLEGDVGLVPLPPD